MLVHVDLSARSVEGVSFKHLLTTSLQFLFLSLRLEAVAVVADDDYLGVRGHGDILNVPVHHLDEFSIDDFEVGMHDTVVVRHLREDIPSAQLFSRREEQ